MCRIHFDLLFSDFYALLFISLTIDIVFWLRCSAVIAMMIGVSKAKYKRILFFSSFSTYYPFHIGNLLDTPDTHDVLCIVFIRLRGIIRISTKFDEYFSYFGNVFFFSLRLQFECLFSEFFVDSYLLIRITGRTERPTHEICRKKKTRRIRTKMNWNN